MKEAALLTTAFLLLVGPVLADDGQRVVNGLMTNDHPAVGALLWVYEDGSSFQSCSGALVGCRHFLTAAHCVCDADRATDCPSPDPSRHLVYLQHGGIYEVSAVELSPNYNFGQRGDIAVLTLANDLERVLPLPINTGGRVGDGTAATVIGYGVTTDNGSDAGIKRRGSVVTAPCQQGVPDLRHVCWKFLRPSGPAGSYSNTCYGDSGSPLLVDDGSGPVAAGVDSGLDGRCVKNSESFDASVYDNRSFIASVAGSDLGAASCGNGLSHVGDAGVETSTLTGSLGFSRAAARCRKTTARATAKWLTSVGKARQRCILSLVSGGQQATCPDNMATAAIAKATAKLGKMLAGKKCPSASVQSAGLSGSCVEAVDSEELAACLLVETSTAVDLFMAAEHAVSEAMIEDAGQRRCQGGAAKSAMRYARSKLKLVDGCRKKADRGPGKGCDPVDTSMRIASLRASLAEKIAVACTNAEVTALNTAGSFGASCATATTAAELATCMIPEHDSALTQLTALLADAEFESNVSFTVPAATELLRVTLNGSEEKGAMFHLHLAHGQAATTADQGSTRASSFQALEWQTPQPGQWHALVKPATSGGNTVGAWQLTATSFGP